MGSYLLVFVIAAAVAAASMPVCMRLARRLGLVDDTRAPPLPRIGGWAIALGTATALALVGVIFAPTGLTLIGASESLGAVVLGSALILLLGSFDDARPMNATVKFLIQILIAVLVYALGVRVEAMSLPFFGSVGIPVPLSLAFTVLWLVGISNALNLLDGADGVAAGSAFFAATAVFIMSVALKHPAAGLVAAALAGSLLGFLPYNFPPARAFLGDSGSLVAGFLLAGLSVEGSTKGPTLVAIAVPLVAFAVPVFDTATAFLRRFMRGQPIFQGDSDHLHHRLQRAGFSPRGVAGVVYAASAAFALVAMLFINPGVRSYAVVLLVLGAGFWLVVRYLRLHELNELARLAQRGMLKPRQIAVNVGLRRAAEQLERVHTLDDLLKALALLLLRTEFDDIVLLVAPANERRGSTTTWRLMDGRFVEDPAPRRADEWEVVCPFDGDGWSGALHLRRRLGRRSLLLDLNLLVEVLQPAVERAARRIPLAEIR